MDEELDEEYDEYSEEDDGSISDSVKEVKEAGQDLKKAVDDNKKAREANSNKNNKGNNSGNKGGTKPAQDAAGNTGKAVNNTAQNAGKAANTTAQTAGKTANATAQTAGKTASTASTAASTTASTAVSTTASATGTAASTTASVAGTTGTAAVAGGATAGVGAIVVAVIALLNAVRKLLKKIRKKIEKKLEEKGVNVKGIKALIIAAPIATIIFIIILILLLILLISGGLAKEKTDYLKEAIACAESSGCTDFMGSKLTISSASVPLGNIAGTIVAATGEALDAAEQATNNKYISLLNESYDLNTSKKLIYFTDLQIARLVVEYLMFDKLYYGVSGNTLVDVGSDTLTALGTEGDSQGVVDWLFNMLVTHGIIGDVYEAYSLFNWLKLEKVAFNKIDWSIYYTGISGTGVSFLDDAENNLCEDTAKWWRSKELKEFCDKKESDVTESLSFKVVGDLNPFTAALWVPTDIWNVGDSIANSAATAFGLNKSKFNKLRSWNGASLPDQETLVNSVYEFLPTWTEIYTLYISTGNIVFANKVYDYYIKNLDAGGELEIKVSLYCLRNYEIAKTTDFGEKSTYYNIYGNDGKLITYTANDGTTKKTEKMTEEQMNEFVADTTKTEKRKTGGEPCTDKDYDSGVCKRKKTTYEYREQICKDYDERYGCISWDWKNVTKKCSDSDYEYGMHDCSYGTTTTPIVEVEETFWQKIKSFASDLETKLRKTWADVKEKLASGWYYASNTFKDYMYTKYPLTLASERNWAISVTKGTTFDNVYEWNYEVKTTKEVEEVEVKASEGFSDEKEINKIKGVSIKNTNNIEDGMVISKSRIAKTSDLSIYQITEYINVKKEITTWTENLNMTSGKTEDYILKYTVTNAEGDDTEVEMKCDNRLAYVIDKMSKDPDSGVKYGSSEFTIAYEIIRNSKKDSYLFAGNYADYSNLTGGAFGWPLETISSPRLSSCTGLRGDVFGGAGTESHSGDDIPAAQGTKILAAKDGEIIINRFNSGGYGYYVVIEHDDGWYTLYGHMVRQSTLPVGTKVTAGQVIGYVGTTGRSTGNHLHFEIRYGKSGGFWSAEIKEPLFYISKSTIPTDLTQDSDAGCPDKVQWGI